MKSDLHEMDRSWRWKASWSTTERSPFAGRAVEVGLRLTRGDGHTNARTYPSVTKGCSRRVETGLSLLTSQRRRSNLGLGALGRRSPRKGSGAARRLYFPATANGGERVWLRPLHARGSKLSRGESALRVVLQKSNDDVTAQRSSRRIFGNDDDDENERELAQSGRPRRAKRRRTTGHGGKTAEPSTRKTGARIRKGVRVAGLSASSDGSRLGSWKPSSLHGEDGESDLGRVGAHRAQVRRANP